MQFLVSTVSADQRIDDLGVILVHPTVDLDLASQFTPTEIANSAHLTALITSFAITVKISTDDYGLSEIDGYYYKPYQLLEQNLQAEFKDGIVTSAEIGAGRNTTAVFASVFPVNITSTDAGTKVVSCSSANFEDWHANTGDKAVIVGGVAAGTYTIASVSDQNAFVVIEAIATTAGVGQLTVYHPVGASIVGFDSVGLLHTSATNVQAAITDLDTALSSVATEIAHDLFNDLVHNLAESCFEEYIYSGSQIVNIIVWNSSNKTTKVRESQYTYLNSKVLQEITIQYNGLGVEIQRLTTNFTYNNNRVMSNTTVESGG